MIPKEQGPIQFACSIDRPAQFPKQSKKQSKKSPDVEAFWRLSLLAGISGPTPPADGSSVAASSFSIAEEHQQRARIDRLSVPII